MARIAVGGFQHETNTFAPSKATFGHFESGEGWPPLTFGDAIAERLDGTNIPAAGAIRALHDAGHETVGLAWAAANPSAQVTRDAFERIAGDIVRRLAAADKVDGVYLDLHGAMVTEHLDDGEGELLARVREVVGPKVPVVASLDLHANVTRAMVDLADGMIAYRTYPHVDMAATGERAARMIGDMLRGGRPLAKHARTLDFLTGLPSQCTTIEPGRRLYALLDRLEREHGAVLSFTPGFAMADFPGCGMAAFGMGADEARVQVAVAALRQAIADAEPEFRLDLLAPDDAVRRAVERGTPGAPVVLADTQDNPGAGGNGDTTGLLSSLLRHDAPGSVLGLLIDPHAAKRAHEVGERRAARFRLGEISGVPGHVPLEGEYIVEKLGDGKFDCTGPMFTGFRMDLGPMALLRRGNVRVVLASVKCQAADQAMFRHVGVEPREERVLALKSSVHFRADFEPIAREVLVVAAPGPAKADPSTFAWKRLRPGLRLKPLGPAFALPPA